MKDGKPEMNVGSTDRDWRTNLQRNSQVCSSDIKRHTGLANMDC